MQFFRDLFSNDNNKNNSNSPWENSSYTRQYSQQYYPTLYAIESKIIALQARLDNWRNESPDIRRELESAKIELQQEEFRLGISKAPAYPNNYQVVESPEALLQRMPNFKAIMSTVEGMVRHLNLPGGHDKEAQAMVGYEFGTYSTRKYRDRGIEYGSYQHWEMFSPSEVLRRKFGITHPNTIVKIAPNEFDVIDRYSPGIIIPNFYPFIQPNNRYNSDRYSEEFGDFFELFPNLTGNIPMKIHHQNGSIEDIIVNCAITCADSAVRFPQPVKNVVATTGLLSRLNGAKALSFDLNSRSIEG